MDAKPGPSSLSGDAGKRWLRPIPTKPSDCSSCDVSKKQRPILAKPSGWSADAGKKQMRKTKISLPLAEYKEFEQIKNELGVTSDYIAVKYLMYE